MVVEATYPGMMPARNAGRYGKVARLKFKIAFKIS